MASIFGFSLRGIVRFRGHEGEPLGQGHIYYNNEKVGFYSEDFCGGEAIVDIDTSYIAVLKDACKKLVTREPELLTEYFAKPDDFSFDCFFSELMELTDIERRFKQKNKNGDCRMAVFNDDEFYTRYEVTLPGFLDSDSVKKHLEKKGHAVRRLRIYTRLEDFEII